MAWAQDFLLVASYLDGVEYNEGVVYRAYITRFYFILFHKINTIFEFKTFFNHHKQNQLNVYIIRLLKCEKKISFCLVFKYTFTNYFSIPNRWEPLASKVGTIFAILGRRFEKCTDPGAIEKFWSFCVSLFTSLVLLKLFSF